MIKLVVGKKGSGKTKTMLGMIADAVGTENGTVVFICNNDRHMLEVNYEVRLVNVSDADTETFRLFKSFIDGILSQNYDISHIFIDSLFKVVPNDRDGLEDFISGLAKLSEDLKINLTVCISADKSELPNSICKYI